MKILNLIHRILALLTVLALPVSANATAVNIHAVELQTQDVVAIGNWHKLNAAGDWTFQPATAIYHLEVACYDSLEGLASGETPFSQSSARSSNTWPDGPENQAGELGDEVAPHVLGDNNTRLYGKPYYRSLRLYDGVLSPDSVYQVSFTGSMPPHIWIHPLYSSYFTMPAQVMQSSESTLQNKAWGPATVTRTIVDADSTRFSYSGLQAGSGTGVKDDYPVQGYGQRSGSHGNGDFGWFPGYSLRFHNEGPGAAYIALFVNTGFTGASGAPPNEWRNDTYWKSGELYLASGQTGIAFLDFDNVQGWNINDNPFPHTAGGKSAPNGISGVSVNIFDRLQVSSIGWEVRSGTGGVTNASLVASPFELAPYGLPVGTITSPQTGDTLLIGSDAFIEWISGTSTASRTIDVSREGGTWDSIATSTPNDGQFTWTVTGPQATNAVIRIYRTGSPGAADSSGIFSIMERVGVKDEELQSSTPVLYPKMRVPNPFSPGGIFFFEIPGKASVLTTLSLFDATGRHITTLAQGEFQPGSYKSLWDGLDVNRRRVPSGVYIASLRVGGYFPVFKKIVVLR